MQPRYSELFRGGNAGRSAVVGGGMILHALNTFIVATILPSVVRDIGGLRYFAWSTVLYVVASLLGGAFCARLLQRVGPRHAYRLALAGFALGSVTCALAPAMPVLLAGRFVQGLAAGTLSALSFTLVRTLFPARLWPRALSLVSVAWGMATLLGPAVGGVFAQYGVWRAAFWSVAAAAPLLLLLVEVSLPRDIARPPAPRTALPVGNLLLLAGSVFAVSLGSMSAQPLANAAGLAAALAGFVVFARREASGGKRLFPVGATDPRAPLAATYGAMIMLLAGTTPEIFVPYFLQTLHGLIPLHAGYVSALMALGWTFGSVGTSGASSALARAALAAGPAVLAAGLAGLALLMPHAGPPGADLVGMAASLAAIGIGIGMTWPHLGARVFGFSSEADRDMAGGSITMVVMVGSALGAATGGMVTSLAGMSAPGGVAGATSASSWLFGLFIFAPLLAALAIRRLPAVVRPAVVE
ncbi:MAG: MFS transporter [Rhodospirillales bacterium]|nr:MFS transporter [Rhodospirillales bacterium]